MELKNKKDEDMKSPYEAFKLNLQDVKCQEELEDDKMPTPFICNSPI